MSQAFKCDRCGKLFETRCLTDFEFKDFPSENDKLRFRVRVDVDGIRYEEGRYCTTYQDLCGQCIKYLIEIGTEFINADLKERYAPKSVNQSTG